MTSVLITNARILTLSGVDGPRRGAAMRNLGVIPRGWIRIEHGRIDEVGKGQAPKAAEPEHGDVIDADGSVVMPAYVDCHTHACWAGSRFDEFEMALRGANYLQILESGGGIMSTVRAVRNAMEEELLLLLVRRLAAMAALGTGTVEIKSGYGLDTPTELKMLRTVHACAQMVPQTILGTFLGAHAIDRENPKFIDQTIEETLPAVVQEFPEITCDAYCEEGAWTLEDTVRLFQAARDHGCPLRVHADQFNSLGMTRVAVEMGATSVDHLEATTETELEMLATSGTFGVMLPCSGFQLDGRYAAGRRFLDLGGALAIATNYNPGSAPTPSMPFAIALACRKLRLTPAEAIAAATWNPACLLGVEDQVGSIEPGKRADIQLLDCVDERELAYEIATLGPLIVILDGKIVHTRAIELEDPETPGDEEDEEAEGLDDLDFDDSDDD